MNFLSWRSGREAESWKESGEDGASSWCYLYHRLTMFTAMSVHATTQKPFNGLKYVLMKTLSAQASHEWRRWWQFLTELHVERLFNWFIDSLSSPRRWACSADVLHIENKLFVLLSWSSKFSFLFIFFSIRIIIMCRTKLYNLRIDIYLSRLLSTNTGGWWERVLCRLGCDNMCRKINSFVEFSSILSNPSCEMEICISAEFPRVSSRGLNLRAEHRGLSICFSHYVTRNAEGKEVSCVGVRERTFA